MSQSHTFSLVEAATNVVVGYAVSVALTWWLIGAGWAQSMRWSVWYVAASLVRGYLLRRSFNHWRQP